MSSTVICRLCLNTNRRSYFINHTVLQETWERLTDAKFDSKDGRPLLACYICCAQLRNSYQLRKRALKAEELFTKYIPNDGFEDSKTLVSLIIGNTCNNDYNYAIEEQHNLDSGQKVPERVEEVKKEIEDEDINIKERDGKVLCYLDEAVTVKEEVLEVDEIDIKEEIEDNIEENNGESGMVYVKTEILPDDEDTLTNRSLEETLQRENQIVLERIDSDVTTKWDKEDLHHTAKQTEINEAIEERNPPNNITSQLKEISTTFDENISHSAHDTADDDSLNVYTNDTVFSCKLCQYECPSKKSYYVHLRKHRTGDKSYECDMCDYRAPYKFDLSQHVTSKHKEGNNYVCHICQKSYPTKSKPGFIVHLYNHTGLKPYKCDFCFYRTSDSTCLRRHVLNLHKNEKGFECNVCQKKFTCNSKLTIHLRRHTGEKPYKCHFCDHRTSSKPGLKIHIKYKHTKEKDFSCHICQKSFVTKSGVKIHLRVHTREKLFKCDLCEHSTKDRTSLRTHLKFIHKKDYSCITCQKKCLSESQLNEHLRVHAEGKT